MKVIEKLQSLVLFPIEDAQLEGALIDRELVAASDYSITDKRKMQLAKADIYVLLLTAPNVSEGGYSISLNEKKALREIATLIYDFYGEPNPLRNMDTIDSDVLW